MSQSETLALLKVKEWLEKRIQKLSFQLEVCSHALERVKTLIAIEEAFSKEVRK